MGRPDIRALTDEIARFKAEVEHLASELVREIIKQQFDGQVAAFRRSPGALTAAAKQPAPTASATRPAKRGAKQRAAAAPPAPPAPSAPQASPPPPAPSAPATSADPARSPAEPAATAASAPATTTPSTTLAAPTAPAAAPAEASTVTGKRSGKRVPWTRERIIDELAAWMPKKGTIDAAFMSRHGPPGLVAATRRIFGRFDAALNVVALHVAKMNPEEPTPR